MHGPPLTHHEVIELLTRDVRKLASVGVPYDRATAEVARRRGIKPSQLELLIDGRAASDDTTPSMPTVQRASGGSSGAVDGSLAA